MTTTATVKTAAQILKDTDIAALLKQAEEAALVEGKRYFEEVMKKRDMDACGFVNLVVEGAFAKGKLAKALLEQDFFKTTWFGKVCYMRSFEHGQRTQGMCCDEAATKAALKVFEEAGFPREVLHIYSQMD